MAKLRTLQDFLDLARITLVDFIAVSGLKTFAKKAELVARTFSAVELKLLIIESSEEEQQAKLKKYYAGRLKKYFLCDPLSVEEAKRTDEVAQEPSIHCGVIFSDILKVRNFDVDYVGRYKDQKAYSYWLSGFLDTIYTYQPQTKRNSLFIYGKVRGSLTATLFQFLRILVQKDP